MEKVQMRKKEISRKEKRKIQNLRDGKGANERDRKKNPGKKNKKN